MSIRLSQLLFILVPKIQNSVLSVQSHPDGFIGLNKLVQFFSEVIILVVQHLNVVIESINLHLDVRVRVQERRVGISSSFQFSPLLINISSSISNGAFNSLQFFAVFIVLCCFILVAFLNISIFFTISLFQIPQMIKIPLGSFRLIMRILHFRIHLLQLLVLLLQLIVLLIDLPLQFVDLIQVFRNIILQLSDVSLRARRFPGLIVVLPLQFFYLHGVFAV